VLASFAGEPHRALRHTTATWVRSLPRRTGSQRSGAKADVMFCTHSLVPFRCSLLLLFVYGCVAYALCFYPLLLLLASAFCLRLCRLCSLLLLLTSTHCFCFCSWLCCLCFLLLLVALLLTLFTSTPYFYSLLLFLLSALSLLLLTFARCLCHCLVCQRFVCLSFYVLLILFVKKHET
jgi:hypothetical protein